jgi:hypothetical protein
MHVSSSLSYSPLLVVLNVLHISFFHQGSKQRKKAGECLVQLCQPLDIMSRKNLSQTAFLRQTTDLLVRIALHLLEQA